MSGDRLWLAYVGVAWVYQDGRKVDVHATLFGEGGAAPHSFFGHYEGAIPGLRDGEAVIRFSDGSEGDAVLAVVDYDTGGFRIDGHLYAAGRRPLPA